MSSEPTALSDPQAYLSLLKFNRRLPRCPRTNLPVTFSELGDPNGIPVVYMLPSGCSRWVAAPMDPLVQLYGVRMIVVDRPGCGGTGQVPLAERIERSTEMVVSVLEHLQIKPAHILASSAGIYYALHFLIHHSSAFPTSLNPPPKLYMLAPWVPLLPSDDPDYWPFRWDWIPTPLIVTQHITTPHLIKAAEQAQKAYDKGLKAFEGGKSFALKWYKSLTEEAKPATPASSTGGLTPTSPPLPYGKQENMSGLGGDTQKLLNGMRGAGVGEGTEVEYPEGEGEGEGEDYPQRERFWGPTPCCITCLMTGYMQAENGQGLGQEHLICLNRGANDTGSQWLKIAMSDLAATIEFAQSPALGGIQDEPSRTYDLREHSDKSHQSKDKEEARQERYKRAKYPLEMHVWWGWLDDMVPRKGQMWFNKLAEGYSDAIDMTIHDVPDGDHADLLSRKEGIHQCLQLIQSQGDSTATLPEPRRG